VSIPIANLWEHSHLSTKILLRQPHMTYFPPLRRLSPTVEFIHHPNLNLFSDHRKSLELFRNLPKSHWAKAHLKSDPNTSSLLARSVQPAWPSLPARPPRAPPLLSSTSPATSLALAYQPAKTDTTPAHLASQPAWPKRPTIPALSSTFVRSKAATVTGLTLSCCCTRVAMAAPFSRCETPSFLHYSIVVIPLQPEL
jgi:hypothetical protein